MKTGYYIKQRKGISELEDVLGEWIKMNQEYVDKEIVSAIYLHREETNTATISSAAWRTGKPSIVEFEQPKGSKYSKYKWTGRADLLIIGKNNTYIFEAKKRKIDISFDDEEINEAIDYMKSHVDFTMNEAEKDTRETQKGSQLKGVAIGIFPIMIKNPNQKSSDKIIDGILYDIETNKWHDAAAWCFPDGNEYIEDKNISHPGVVLMFKSI